MLLKFHSNLFIFFNISGLLPEFTTAPSAIANKDGFTYITGCTYTIKEDLSVDLAEFSFLLVNDEVKIKLTGGSRKLTANMFQLPSNRFIIPGKYKCIIEAKNFYNETINSTSTDIPMPGIYILYRSSCLQMFFEIGVLKNVETTFFAEYL